MGGLERALINNMYVLKMTFSPKTHTLLDSSGPAPRGSETTVTPRRDLVPIFCRPPQDRPPALPRGPCRRARATA